jgi:hypothetical protein
MDLRRTPPQDRLTPDGSMRGCTRVLRPAGRLLLVEHCRNAANLAAYGPGAWHFYPRREWLRLASGAGLTPAGETTMTPLVHILVFAR